ncbi:MAG: hypothetical protein VR69_02860 [Peptococcaceae bacterium BRH_c4b]|nr:MAG: hypothetical protein VR69_02860 [Peptococcaceae bacterium BRH_c4b]
MFETIVVLLLLTLLILLSASFFQNSQENRSNNQRKNGIYRRQLKTKGKPSGVYSVRRGDRGASIYIYVSPSYQTMVMERNRKSANDSSDNNKLIDLRV